MAEEQIPLARDCAIHRCQQCREEAERRQREEEEGPFKALFGFVLGGIVLSVLCAGAALYLFLGDCSPPSCYPMPWVRNTVGVCFALASLLAGPALFLIGLEGWREWRAEGKEAAAE